jgi:hypothetical protein
VPRSGGTAARVNSAEPEVRLLISPCGAHGRDGRSADGRTLPRPRPLIEDARAGRIDASQEARGSPPAEARTGARCADAGEATYTFTTSRPNFGGVRWWLVCQCGRRVATMYRAEEHGGHICRTCAGLSYLSQRLKAPERLLHRAEKLRVRLGEAGLWPVPRAAGSRRPKWMRRATFARLRAEIERLEGDALARAVYG